QSDSVLARAAFGPAGPALAEVALAGAVDRLRHPAARLVVGTRGPSAAGDLLSDLPDLPVDPDDHPFLSSAGYWSGSDLTPLSDDVQSDTLPADLDLGFLD